MIACSNFKYNKEYQELIEAFIPNFKDKGLNIFLEKTKEQLLVNIGQEKITKEIDKYFNIEKSNIKRCLYSIFSKYTNKELAWGILVGVNPLKLFRKLEAEFGREKAEEILQNGYLVSKEKIKLGFLVVDKQEKILENQFGNNSIYINIPFCPTKCNYCSYPTYLVDEERVEKYTKALEKEIRLFFEKTSLEISTAYIGGGTPSSIGASRLDRIIKLVKDRNNNIREFTVEVGRPDTINEELIDMLKQNKINRISINPQTMINKTLETIGRKHNKEEILSTYKLAKKKGFDNINMDLIMGLPGEDADDFAKSLEEVVSLEPASISIHSLSLKKGSKLTESGYENNKSGDFEDLRNTIMKKSGYFPYYLYRQKHMYLNIENIGYAKEGCESLYNIFMMEDVHNIIGFGLAATSKKIEKNKIFRYMNPRLMDSYLDNIEKIVDEKISLLRSN